ncbi:MAG: heparinase II/III family protein [Rhodoglobus sp.]
MPPATERDAWNATTGVPDLLTRQDILRRAEADLGSAWPQPLASAAVRVHRDGDRDGWEQVAFARQRRLSRAALAAAFTLDDRWIDEVADGVVLLCEQSTWCWPAHDDAARRHGAVLGVVTDPYVDLGAGEVAGQLAWLDHLLADQLDARYPGLRHRMAHEVQTRVLDPFVRRRDWHWLGLDGDVHNWNPWIHGNVLVAALRFAQDSEAQADVVALVIDGLDRYVASLPADGAIDEGFGYWWNGALRALEALDILSHATGGRLDAAELPALRETVAFPHRMHLGGPWYVNFADSQARPTSEHPWHALHRAARRIGDVQALAHAAAHRDPATPACDESEGLGRLLRGITDLDWLAAGTAASPLPRDVWLPSTQVLVARVSEKSSVGLTLAIKGGTNGEHHNHNDVGSFVIASDGVPVIVDAGRPTYTAATFGPDRYDIWTMQSSWHSVPEIRGTAQGAGEAFAAKDVHAAIESDVTAIELDIAPAYPVAGLGSWRRSAALDRRHARITVSDVWDLEPWTGSAAEPPTTVRLLVAGEVQLAPGEARITPLEGATPVVVRWDPGATASTTVRELDDPVLSSVWGSRLRRIEIDVTGRDHLEVTVEMDPPISGDEE